MATDNPIKAFIEDRVSNIYRSPRGYALTASELDTLLRAYIELLAEMAGGRDVFWRAFRAIKDSNRFDGCWSHAIRERFPTASDEEIMQRVCELWREAQEHISAGK